MQNILIEKPYQFVQPVKSSWPQSLLLNMGLFRSALRKRDGVVDHECRNLDLIRKSIADGHGIMMTPNHPRTADPGSMCFLAREVPTPFYVMASWHLFNQGAYTRFMVRLMGAFSVNREGLDKSSVDFAIKTLQTAERPLLIFPEGTTSRTNDRLMSLMEGPAFIARTAAKRRAKQGGEVVVHPIGLKYIYQGNLEKACDEVLTEIETKLTWRPRKHLGLIDRIVGVGNALLALKELQYGADAGPNATLRERQTNMVNHLLNPLEQEWLGSPQNSGIAKRIKALRMKIFPEMSRAEVDPIERQRRWTQLEDTYLAQQIDCYPEQYVTQLPSRDRILETVEKFEEDLTTQCRIHGHLKVLIDVDEAIKVDPQRDRSTKTDPLIVQIRERLELKLKQLESESKIFAE